MVTVYVDNYFEQTSYLFGQSSAEMSMDDLSLVSQKPQLENLPTDSDKQAFN